MGVPTTANYVITSTIAAPALLRLGVPVLAAHMFAFYFGIIADVTPPVALAAMAGAGIARANPMRTGLTASRLAIAAFLVPYAFVLSPQLLLVNVSNPVRVIWPLLTCVVGLFSLSGALSGYLLGNLAAWERAFCGIGGVLLVEPSGYTDLIGLGLIAVAFLFQRARMRLTKKA
jgi:TRAP-type uncharacterized transport system fused permease subunit